jgi:hypothetical protein
VLLREPPLLREPELLELLLREVVPPRELPPELPPLLLRELERVPAPPLREALLRELLPREVVPPREPEPLLLPPLLLRELLDPREPVLREEELPLRALVPRELLLREPVPREPVPRELVPRELVPRELVPLLRVPEPPLFLVLATDDPFYEATVPRHPRSAKCGRASGLFGASQRVSGSVVNRLTKCREIRFTRRDFGRAAVEERVPSAECRAPGQDSR